MRSDGEFASQGVADEHSFAADVFHALSQPLTALHCSLELSLARDKTAEDLRASMKAVLHDAERLRQRLLLLRELGDADDPGDISAPVELQLLLAGLREDLLPVFESWGGRFDLTCDPLQVRGNTDKLTRGFFHLLDSVARRYPQADLSIGVQPIAGGQIEIRIAFSGAACSMSPRDVLSEYVAAGEVEIARRIFRAVGGNLTSTASACGQSLWTVRLPLAL